jgi:hypothetical protein
MAFVVDSQQNTKKVAYWIDKGFLHQPQPPTYTTNSDSSMVCANCWMSHICDHLLKLLPVDSNRRTNQKSNVDLNCWQRTQVVEQNLILVMAPQQVNPNISICAVSELQPLYLTNYKSLYFLFLLTWDSGQKAATSRHWQKNSWRQLSPMLQV